MLKKAQESFSSTVSAQSSLTEVSPEGQGGDHNYSQPIQPYNINPVAEQNTFTQEEQPPKQPSEGKKIVKKLVSSKQSLPRVFLLTATFSALIGASCGFAFRFVITGKFGYSLFHAEQSFPPIENWPQQSLEWLSDPMPEIQDLPHDSELNPQQQPPASENSLITPANDPINPDSAHNYTREAAVFSESETLPQPELETEQNLQTPIDDQSSLPESSFVPKADIR